MNSTTAKNSTKAKVSAAIAIGLASAFAVAVASPGVAASSVQDPTQNLNAQHVTSAYTFTSVNHSGEAVLLAANGDQYALSGCQASVSDHSVSLRGCTGSGDAGFFDGQTPTQAELTGVSKDGQSHTGTITISGTDATGSSTVLMTLSFPASGSGSTSGCVFHPDSTTSAYSCAGGDGR